ncbi:hypothetical protein AUQ42_07080 [Thalassospira sp. MCCC 1A02491]|nr:hypothetical protein AUQ42_07080 [Thalassospira sp. MCCC 1A02491]
MHIFMPEKLCPFVTDVLALNNFKPHMPACKPHAGAGHPLTLSKLVIGQPRRAIFCASDAQI